MPSLRQLALALPLALGPLLACDGDGDSGTDDVGTEDSGDSTGGATDTGTGTETGTGTDTTTEGTDTTDTGTDTTTGGSNDPAAQACEAFANATPEPVIAALTAGEAATATLVSGSDVVYLVTLPEGAAGFVSLEIPEWETTQAFFTVADIDYTVTVVDNSLVAQPRQPDAACPEAGITDQRIYFPHWTPALIEFSATGPREVALMIIREPA